jgi:hypothetical protein
MERSAAAASLELKAHPHMLRHACDSALVNMCDDTRAIQAWLGRSQHRGLHGAGAEPVQGLLAGLTLLLAGTAPVVEGVEDGATSAIVQWDLV